MRHNFHLPFTNNWNKKINTNNIKHISNMEDYQEDFYDNYDSYEEQSYEDYERETFYALTDGMYGDYEDWAEDGGSIDSLREFLGYD